MRRARAEADALRAARRADLDGARTLTFATGIALAVPRVRLPACCRARLVARAGRRRSSRSVVVHQRARVAERRAARAARFYDGRARAARRHLGGQGRRRRALPRPGASVCGRPRSLRPRLALRAALHRAHAGRRGDAGALAARARGRRRGAGAAAGRRRAAPRLDLREDDGAARRGRRAARSIPPRSTAWAASADWHVDDRRARARRRCLPVVTVAALRRRGISAGSDPCADAGGAAPCRSRSRCAAPPARAAGAAARQPAGRPPGASRRPARAHRARDASRRRASSRSRPTSKSAGEPPSRRIARLQRLIDLLDAHRNQVFAVARRSRSSGAPTSRSRSRRGARVSGPAVPRWLAAIGEFEALLALASHAFEHPDDPFPELVDGPPRFDGARARPSAACRGALRPERRAPRRPACAS